MEKLLFQKGKKKYILSVGELKIKTVLKCIFKKFSNIPASLFLLSYGIFKKKNKNKEILFRVCLR